MTDDQPTPGRSQTAPAGRSDVPIYEIRVKGRLGSGWAAWFDGLDVENSGDGTSVLRGPVIDQAALHGLLHRLRDLGLVLESLVQVDTRPIEASTDDTHDQDLPSTNTNTSGAPS